MNECGWKNRALIVAQLGCIDTGMAGKVGFIHPGGHPRFEKPLLLLRPRRFFPRRQWEGKRCYHARALASSARPSRTQKASRDADGPDQRPKIAPARNLWLAFLNAATIPKLAIYVIAISAIPVYIWFLIEKEQVSQLRTRAVQQEKNLAEADLRATRRLMLREEMIDATKLSPLLANTTIHKRSRQLLIDSVKGTRSSELDSERRAYSTCSPSGEPTPT